MKTITSQNAASTKFNYDELVRDDVVDSRIFTDQEIFEEEVTNIFHKQWLYVAHTSQISEPGDYITTWLGRVPVIVARDEDLGIQVFANRCTHRGNTVCQAESGNASFFKCCYHGWTFKNTGDLIGVPYSDGYNNSLDKKNLGLAKVPRISEYRGLIFASLSSSGPTLDEHLGKAKALIDLFVDQSPVGEIELKAGVNKGKFKGNWKFVGMDGYHVEFAHESIAKLQTKANSRGFNVSVTGLPRKNRTRSYGNGHVRLEYNARLDQMEETIASLRNSTWGSEYLKSMENAYGVEKAHQLVSLKTPHAGIWPNIQLIDAHIRVIFPISADETIIHMYPATLKGVPDEINEARLQNHIWFYGPASFGSPDDYEIFERNKVGLQAALKPELVLQRGLHRETVDDDGTVFANYSDELTQREQLQQWKKVMKESE